MSINTETVTDMWILWYAAHYGMVCPSVLDLFSWSIFRLSDDWNAWVSCCFTSNKMWNSMWWVCERNLRLCQQQSHMKCRKCITSASSSRFNTTPEIMIKDALAIQVRLLSTHEELVVVVGIVVAPCACQERYAGNSHGNIVNAHCPRSCI